MARAVEAMARAVKTMARAVEAMARAVKAMARAIEAMARAVVEAQTASHALTSRRITAHLDAATLKHVTKLAGLCKPLAPLPMALAPPALAPSVSVARMYP